MANRNMQNQTVTLVKDYLKNLVKASVLTNDQFIETVNKLKQQQEIRPETQKPDRLISKREVAVLLGYKDPRTIDRFEKKGLIQRVELPGVNIRYRLSDAEKLFTVHS